MTSKRDRDRAGQLGTPGTPHTTAYRGYLIRQHPLFDDRIWIEKDSVRIAWVHGTGHARTIIDNLLHLSDIATDPDPRD